MLGNGGVATGSGVLGWFRTRKGPDTTGNEGAVGL